MNDTNIIHYVQEVLVVLLSKFLQPSRDYIGYTVFTKTDSL